MNTQRALRPLAMLLAALCAAALSSCVIIDGQIMPYYQYKGIGLVPAEPRCEGRVSPLGVDSAAPRLSWSLSPVDPKMRGLGMREYRVLVASSLAELAKDKGDLWNSGRVKSGDPRAVYDGDALQANQECFWKVMIWDLTGASTAWSAPATFTMGLKPADWQAKWVRLEDKPSTGSLMMRRDFTVKAGLARAVLNVCGLGASECSLNGVKVGEDLLTPGWTDYRKTVLYGTHDVTKMLRPGANAAAVLIGNSFYDVLNAKGRYRKLGIEFGPQKLIAQLRLEYQDGSVEYVITDKSWIARKGPLTFSSVYGGEDYDARLEPEGWKMAGYNGADWSRAIETEGPGGVLRGVSRDGWPIRVIETLKPVGQKQIDAATTVYDLGQNAPIMPRLTVSGQAGAVVRIHPSELVKADGTMDDTACRGHSYWTYTLKGDGQEVWFPKFFYRGGRYLQVECTAPEGGVLPFVSSIEGVVVHANAPSVGEFECSNPLFNRIATLVRWAQRGNMMSCLTDCPHREKLGWLEQDHLNGPSLRYNFDLDPLFEKILGDIADTQQPSGLVPSIAPEYIVFKEWWGGMQFRESPEWGSACILIPWQQWQFSADKELVRRSYPVMKRYMDYLATLTKGGILSMPGSLGDWYDVGPKAPGRAQLTPIDLTATAIYYEDATVMARFAKILDNDADAEAFAALAAQVKAAFNTKWFHSDTGAYAEGSQTANAMPLALGMAPEGHEGEILNAIVADVQKRGLTAGDVGYRYLLRALADNGRSDVVYAMNNQDDKPGYGYQLKMGATSLTEAWAARRENSQNHFMLGQINEWLYHDLAGIQPLKSSPGFERVIINPAIVGDLTHVRASYRSVRGVVASEWRREGAKVTMDLTIPPGTQAAVRVPAFSEADVTEGGAAALEADGVSFVRMEKGGAIFNVGSGQYHFESPNGAPLK